MPVILSSVSSRVSGFIELGMHLHACGHNSPTCTHTRLCTHRHIHRPLTHLDGHVHVVQKLEGAGLVACLQHCLTKVCCTSPSQAVVVADGGSFSPCALSCSLKLDQ